MEVLGTKKVLKILEGGKLIIENVELFLSLQIFFSVIRPFALVNCYLSNLGSYPPTEHSSMLTFQRSTPRSLKNTFPGL